MNVPCVTNLLYICRVNAGQDPAKVSLNTHKTMAIMQGITGKMSGKMGSAVFRVRNGAQVVTQYNPIVKNPDSAGQKSQRAKFKLMSQLAAIMSPGFGTMAVTKRASKGTPSQRNAFTQINFPLVEVLSDNENVTAKIPMEQLKLTSSFRHLPPLAITETTNEIDVEIANIDTSVASVRYVVVGYNNNVASILHIQDDPVQNGGSSLSYVTGAGKYTVLAYGLIPSEAGKTTIDLDNIHTPADEDFISAIELNTMVAEGLMAETKTVGINVTVTES